MEDSLETSQVIPKGFTEFWELYLREHQRPLTCLLHAFGTITSIVFYVVVLWSERYALLPLGIVIGYFPAWLSHLLIEKNRPLSFRAPLRSLVCDYLLTFYFLTGRIPVMKQTSE